MTRRVLLLSLTAIFLSAANVSAACVNKYLNRPDGVKQVVTLLTGKLTFQEAQSLARSITSRQAAPLEWVDDSGKSIAKQFGEMKVVRPMPVGCDGKPSGVVMIATFNSVRPPSGTMSIKIDPNTVVQFAEQRD